MNQKILPFAATGGAMLAIIGLAAITAWNANDIYKLQKFMLEQKVRNVEQEFDKHLNNMNMKAATIIDKSMADKVSRMDQDITNLTAQVNKLQSENSKEESKTEK